MTAKMRLTCGPIQLRLATPRSAQQLFALARDPELSRFLQWHPHRTVDDSLNYIADTHSLWERRVAFLPAVFRCEDDALVGSTGVSALDRANHRGEVGTWLGIPYQGQGMNRYVKAAIFTFGFDVLGLHRMELLVRCDNEQSLRATRRLPCLLEEGVQHARIVRDDVAYDAQMFAVTRASWDAEQYPAVIVEGALA